MGGRFAAEGQRCGGRAREPNVANTNTRPTRRGAPTPTHGAAACRRRGESRTFLWKLFVFVYSRLNLLRDYIYISVCCYCYCFCLLLLLFFPRFFFFGDSREIKFFIFFFKKNKLFFFLDDRDVGYAAPFIVLIYIYI